MAKLKNFDVVREKWLKDYETKKNYDALETEFQIAAEIIKARTNAHMTQAELAEKLGTKPTAISRMESPNYGRVSVSTLQKIAGALNCDLKIEFLPKKRGHLVDVP
jgi:ribosome-binding protein aMBF1 (putative translation factor)